MKKYSKYIVVFMVIFSFVLSISAPVVYAWPSTPYHNDWFYPSDDVTNPPFMDTEYGNIYIADFRGTLAGFWVVYRPKAVIYVEATIKEDGKTHKEVIELTKEQYSIWTQYCKIVLKMQLKYLKGDPTVRKISEGSWECNDKKPWVIYPIPNCEIKDLVSGKILRNESDGYFISTHYTVTEITKPKQ